MCIRYLEKKKKKKSVKNNNISYWGKAFSRCIYVCILSFGLN